MAGVCGNGYVGEFVWNGFEGLEICLSVVFRSGRKRDCAGRWATWESVSNGFWDLEKQGVDGLAAMDGARFGACLSQNEMRSGVITSAYERLTIRRRKAAEGLRTSDEKIVPTAYTYIRSHTCSSALPLSPEHILLCHSFLLPASCSLLPLFPQVGLTMLSHQHREASVHAQVAIHQHGTSKIDTGLAISEFGLKLCGVDRIAS